MAFDAGTIDARLTIDPAAFDRSLAKAKADVKKFEDDGHKVKISAVFDDGSVSRARKMFADLDNAISRDAMNRLKSSPQGSVLGSLNALFSPHPVTGAPSPSQSAEGGLLGKMLNPQTSGSGGGYSNASGSPLADALTGAADSTDNIRQNLVGAQPGNVTTTDDIRQALIGQAPGNVDTTDQIRQALIGQGATNTTTTDDIKQALTGQGATNTTTTDTIKQALVGNAPGNVSTTDTVKEKLDPKSAGDVEKAAEDSGGRAGGGWTLGFGAHLGPFFTSFHKRLGDEGDSGGKAMGAGLLGGIGPGILGIGMKMSGIVGLIGSALGALPALAGIIGVGMGVAMVGGLVAGAIMLNPALKKQMSGIGADAKTMFTQAIAPLVPFLKMVFAQIPPLIKSIEPILAGISKVVGPQLMGILNQLAPVIGGLLNIMKAAAPAFGPFIEALEQLLGNLLPGIAIVIKATVPFLSEFTGILGSLGGSLGGLFATAAPAIGASMKILGGLLGLVGALLPIVMRLADIFAATLAPVFTAFAGVVQTLLGPLTLIGSVIAQFAGAVLGDLGSAFAAVATLITAIGPGLNILAKAFGSLFTVLENAGVFAIFGDALENLAPALGKLIGLLITDLAPILPMIVGLFSQLLTVTIDLASAGLGTLIRVLTDLVQALPVGVIQALVGGFIALKLVMMGFEGVGAIFSGVAAAVTGLSAALDFDTIALKAMYAWDLLVTAAQTAWDAVMIVADALMSLTPLGLIVIGIAALIAAIVLLATHWSQVWAAVQAVAKDAATFLTGLWGDVETTAKTVWGDIASFFTSWWAGEIAAWKADVATVEGLFSAAWGAVTTALKTAWNAIATFFTGWWNSETAAFRADVALVKSLLSTAWADVTATVRSAWNAIAAFFAGWWAGQVAAFRSTAGQIEAVLSGAWNAVYATIKAVWGDILGLFRSVAGDIMGAISGLGGDLRTWGSGVMTDMFDGIKSVWGDIIGFFGGLAKDILHALGINSPPSWAIDAGKFIMQGIGIGMSQAQSAVTKATALVEQGLNSHLSGAAGSIQALMKSMAAARGWTGTLWGDLNAVEMREAGYNPNAQNPTSNAYGLAQFINGASEYAQWGGNASTVAGQITAMLNYIASRYGNPANAWLHEQAFDWYGSGGPINEPVVGYGVHSGRGYVFGENGPEYVTPGGGPPGSDPAMLARLDQLIAATRQIPAGVGNTVGGAIGGSAHAASFRSRYPRGGA